MGLIIWVGGDWDVYYFIFNCEFFNVVVVVNKYYFFFEEFGWWGIKCDLNIEDFLVRINFNLFKEM